MSKLRSGDEVKVITGSFVGRQGKVLAVLGNRVIVDGVNIKKKSVKRRGPESPSFVEFAGPIDKSNVMICVNGDAVRIKTRWHNGIKELGFFNKKQEWSVYRVVGNVHKKPVQQGSPDVVVLNQKQKQRKPLVKSSRVSVAAVDQSPVVEVEKKKKSVVKTQKRDSKKAKMVKKPRVSGIGFEHKADVRKSGKTMHSARGVTSKTASTRRVMKLRDKSE